MTLAITAATLRQNRQASRHPRPPCQAPPSERQALLTSLMPPEPSRPAPYLLDASEVVLQFNTPVGNGLSEAQAQERLAAVGSGSCNLRLIRAVSSATRFFVKRHHFRQMTLNFGYPIAVSRVRRQPLRRPATVRGLHFLP